MNRGLQLKKLWSSSDRAQVLTCAGDIFKEEEAQLHREQLAAKIERRS